MTDIDLNDLATKTKAAFDSLLISKTLPSASEIYCASNLLYDLKHAYLSDVSNDIVQLISESFYSVLSSIDESYLSSIVLKDIQLAFKKIIHEASIEPIPSRIEKCVEGSKVFWVLYANKDTSKFSQRLCALGFNIDLCLLMRRLYDLSSSTTKGSTFSRNDTIMSILSSLILDGLIESFTMKVQSEDVTLNHVIETIQVLSSDNSYCLGDLLRWQLENRNIVTMEQAIDFRFSKEVQMQKDYIKSILNTSLESISSLTTDRLQTQGTSTTNAKSKGIKMSGVQRLVSQIKSFFPHYGDGYLEAALACYNYDLDRTISVLLEAESDPSSLHPRLQVLDRNLPARKRDSKDNYLSMTDPDDIDAIAVQKSRMKKSEQDEEYDAYLLGVAMHEYNDEYDDQYDGIGDDGGATGGIGAADSGLYDMNYNAIKAYNRIVKAVEAETAFWEESRNVNRQKSKSENTSKEMDHTTDADDIESGNINNNAQITKKFRGPDKGKGGRLLGPDGKYLPFPKKKQITHHQQHEASTFTPKIAADLTKIQKLRKNENKAKIGNHSRKDRAMKKSNV